MPRTRSQSPSPPRPPASPSHPVPPSSSTPTSPTPTTSGYQITDATFTSTDPLVTAEVADAQISTLFDGADGMGDPFTVAPSPPNTLVPGVFELDLDATVPPGQTVSGSVGFDGFLLDSTGQRTGQSIEVASSSFSVVTATAAPEPSSFALFGFLGLGITGLVLKARKGKAVA